MHRIAFLAIFLSTLLLQTEVRAQTCLKDKLVSLISSKIEQISRRKADRLPLANKNSPVLTREARDIASAEMTSQNIRRLSDKMIVTMKAEGGVGLAAPQVGQGLKLIVFKSSGGKNRIMANPVVTKISDKTKKRIEGCLSLKGVNCSVERPSEISVQFLDTDGVVKTEKFSGFDATVIQHEADHINGILFPFQSKTFAKKFGVKNSDTFSARSNDNLGRFLHTLNDDEIKVLKNKFAKRMSANIKEIDDPRSLISSLNTIEGLKNRDHVFNEVLNLYSIAVKTSKSSEKFKKYNLWVKSKEHALLYTIIYYHSDLKKIKIY